MELGVCGISVVMFKSIENVKTKSFKGFFFLRDIYWVSQFELHNELSRL